MLVVEWGQTQDQPCDCGVDVPTMEHIVIECNLRSLWEGMACLHSIGEAGLAKRVGIGFETGDFLLFSFQTMEHIIYV